MPRLSRRRLRLLLLGLCVPLLLILSGWYYLRTEHAARVVAHKLGEIIGAPVRIEQLRVGWRRTRLTGLEVQDRSNPALNVLRAEHVEVELSLWDALLGNPMPTHLRLRDVSARLCFDADANLVSRLPEPAGTSKAVRWPTIQIDQGRLTIEEIHRQPFVIQGIAAKLKPVDHKLHLLGSIGDSVWGNWSVTGTFEPEPASLLLTIQSVGPARLDMANLRALPLIPASVWNDIEVAGLAQAQIRLEHSPGSVKRPPTVTLQASQTALRLPSIDWHMTNASGTVEVSGAFIHIREWQGETADGTIRVHGTVDFRHDPARLQLAASVRDVNVRALPSAWKMPEKLEGLLSGSAQLELIIPKSGPMETRGEGRGTVRSARLAGKPVERLELHLKAQNNGFVFASVPDETNGDRPNTATGRDQPHVSESTGDLTHLASYAMKWVAFFVKPREAPADERSYLHVDIALKEVDLAELVKGLGFELPFQAQGKISLDARIDIPTEATDDLAKYRVRGSVKTQDLELNGIRIDGLEGEIIVRDGIAQLQTRKAKSLGGELLLDLRYPLKANLAGSGKITFQRIDLTQLSQQLLGKAKLRIEGQADGTIQARIPIAQPGVSRTYFADLELQAPRLKLQNLPAEKIQGSARYEGGKLEYLLTGKTLGGQFEIRGQYPPTIPKKLSRVDPPGPPGLFEGRIQFRRLQLARAGDLFGVGDFLRPLRGELSLEVSYRVDRTGKVVGEGRLRIEQVLWGDRELMPFVNCVIKLSAQEVRLEEIVSSLGDGRVRGRVRFDLQRIEQSHFSLTLERIPASKLFLPFPQLAQSCDMPLDLRLQGNLGPAMHGSGSIGSTGGTIRGVPLRDVRIPIEWRFSDIARSGEVQVREIVGTIAHGNVQGKLTIHLPYDLPPCIRGSLQFRGVNVVALTGSRNANTGRNDLSGRLDFSANQFRSLNDVQATLQANLAEAQPFILPVLEDLLPYLGTPLSPSFRVQQGEIRASLGQGVWRLQKFTLQAQQLELYAEGTVHLDSRLDLMIVASTGSLGLEARVLRSAGITLPRQISMLTTATTNQIAGYLSNRVIHLEVRGTIQTHTVRVKAIPTLTDSAIRYFLSRAGLPG